MIIAVLKIPKCLNWILCTWICEHNEHAVYSACCFCVVTHPAALWLAEVVVWSKGCYLRAGTFQEKCRHEGKSLSRVPAVAGQAEWMFIIHVKWKDSGRTACPYASILQSYVQLSVCFYSLLPGQAFMGGIIHPFSILSQVMWQKMSHDLWQDAKRVYLKCILQEKAKDNSNITVINLRQWMLCWSFLFTYMTF